MTPVIDIDVIILGAGPAGLSTAMHLLQRDPGWAERMIVLEKSRHPRPKLCGGGVTRLGLSALQKLGFDLPLPLPQARVDDIRLDYKGRTIHVYGRPQIAIFQRSEFDAYLVQEAAQRGVNVRQSEAALNYRITPDGVEIETTRNLYRAAVLVGADGSKGLVRRKLAHLERNTHTARLLEVIQPGEESADAFVQRFARFEFSAVRHALQGYFWDFPTRQHGEPAFNRGVYDARIARKRKRASLPVILQDGLVSLNGDVEGGVAGHPIHWFSPRSILSVGRMILVGDAAGVDPLFGEGIGPALAYGYTAAKAISNAFTRQDFTFADYRRRLWSSPVGRYLWLRYMIAWLAYRFSGRDWYMRSLWAVGNAVANLWPVPPPLYPQD